MRRGSLHNMAKEYGANKLALGHHFDDAAETMMLNLFFEAEGGLFFSGYIPFPKGDNRHPSPYSDRGADD